MQYERELAKGLASTQAICAVARKIAKVAWALVRSGDDYDPQRVHSRTVPFDPDYENKRFAERSLALQVA
jgi:hypothetical protein